MSDTLKDKMSQKLEPLVPPGWKGGFPESNPDFAYPHPDLSSLPMLGNMANIDKLQRQQAAVWPEFSWLTPELRKDPRCFRMFAPYISRIGYTDEGRVYSIICPQQGVWIKDEVCFNVEVTVESQRGWVDEDSRELAAEMRVVPRVWFSPSQRPDSLAHILWPLLENWPQPYPTSKANAIKINTYKPGDPDQHIIDVRRNTSPRYEVPGFADHSDEAWSVAHVDVEIGDIMETGDTTVDAFNEIVFDLFNIAAGDMLKAEEILSWNIWFREPQLVDQHEWKTHAERWRDAIDAHHPPPHGAGKQPKYANGEPYHPGDLAIIEEALEDIIQFIKEHHGLDPSFFRKEKGKILDATT